MPTPLGEPPDFAQQRRRACDVRRAIERRFAESPNEHEEGGLTAAVADRYVEAVKEGDDKKVAFLRGVTTDICGPQRQGLDVNARVYSIVNIVGEDDDEPEGAGT